MADYPDAITSLTNPVAADSMATVSHSDQHIKANDEIEAIETELGIDPAGASATVVARLDASDVLVAFNTTHRGLTNNPHGVTGAQITGTSLAAAIVTSSLTALGTIASLVATTADINAGTFDGTIGGTTPGVGTFTTLTQMTSNSIFWENEAIAYENDAIYYTT